MALSFSHQHGQLWQDGLKTNVNLLPTVIKNLLSVSMRNSPGDWKENCAGMGVPMGDFETLSTLSFANDLR